ncbi:hypothetical protein Pelo_8205 [Pelomyxa schiedti]|nr:hypothetical protein Pelo_8205 [Pelomyxa schiedti]
MGTQVVIIGPIPCISGTLNSDADLRTISHKDNGSDSVDTRNDQFNLLRRYPGAQHCTPSISVFWHLVIQIYCNNHSRRIETTNVKGHASTHPQQPLEVMPISTDLIHSTTACRPHSAFTSTHQYHDSTHAATKQNSAGVPKCPLAHARITVALAGSTATAPQ